jgi:hypothetical protein
MLKIARTIDLCKPLKALNPSMSLKRFSSARDPSFWAQMVSTHLISFVAVISAGKVSGCPALMVV